MVLGLSPREMREVIITQLLAIPLLGLAALFATGILFNVWFTYLLWSFITGTFEDIKEYRQWLVARDSVLYGKIVYLSKNDRWRT